MQTDAYRELLLRGEINEKAKALLLAYATGSDLDQIGATYDDARMVITPEDDTTVPPTPAVIESDDRFRARIQLAPDAFSTVGPWGAYVYWALTTDGSIVDANAVAPNVGGVPDGRVNVYVIGANGQPIADDVILKLLTFYQTADVVPLTDVPSVINATVLSYDVSIQLTTARGPDPTLIKAQAGASRTSLRSERLQDRADRLRQRAARCGQGRRRAQRTSTNLTDITCDGTQIPWLRSLTVTTQDETTVQQTSGAPAPVIDGGSF